MGPCEDPFWTLLGQHLTFRVNEPLSLNPFSSIPTEEIYAKDRQDSLGQLSSVLRVMAAPRDARCRSWNPRQLWRSVRSSPVPLPPPGRREPRRQARRPSRCQPPPREQSAESTDACHVLLGEDNAFRGIIYLFALSEISEINEFTLQVR